MAQIKLNGIAEVVRRTRLYRALGPKHPDAPARRVEVEIKGDARNLTRKES